jgi:Cytochrome C oxidase, cbb3-type, subunit III
MSWGGFNWHVIAAIVALMLVLRWRRVGMLVWTVAWAVAFWLFVTFGFEKPVPSSVVKLYSGIAAAALFAYVTSSRERVAAVTGPIVKLIVERRYRRGLVALLVLLPALAAYSAWRAATVPLEAPVFGRTVHPAPPESITVHDEAIDLIRAVNPYGELKAGDPAKYAEHAANGRRVYYENCFFCHGDAMAGDGMFVYGVTPQPTSFTDAGNLPNLQASFVFWRIAKGGPGLPEEGGPWDTAMPRWEQFLTNDEIWDVNLYLYEFTGLAPRALEEVHE